MDSGFFYDRKVVKKSRIGGQQSGNRLLCSLHNQEKFSGGDGDKPDRPGQCLGPYRSNLRRRL